MKNNDKITNEINPKIQALFTSSLLITSVITANTFVQTAIKQHMQKPEPFAISPIETNNTQTER